MEEHKPSHTSGDAAGMIDQLPPRMAFWSGVIVTGGVIFAIGFVAVIIMMFKGVEVVMPESAGTTTKKTTTNANVNTNVVANTNAAVQPTAAGTVDMSTLSNVRGTGDLTVVEYSDPECPFCKRFHTTMQQVVSDYDGKVKWGYKHLPLTSLHPKAQREALALECAAEQSKFWEYTDAIYERTPSNNGLPDEDLFTVADDLGLDRGQFDDCLESEKYLDKIKADSAEAQALGGTGTPFSVLVDADGKILESFPGALPITSISSALDSNLE